MRILSFALSLVLTSCLGAPEANIALNRTASASSNYDHNLTAQLVTDGILLQGSPAWLETVSSDGPVDRVERENALDGDTNTRNIITGDHGWMEWRFHGYEVQAEEAEVLFQEALKGGRGGPRHTVVVPVHRDGSSLRIELSFPNDGRWRVKEVVFLHNGEPVGDILPSNHFSSAWMSAGTGDEWVMVDLGSIQRVHSVNPVWINAPADSKIELSRDGKKWKTANHGRGRFVRISISGGTTDGLPYCLSEVEVLGPAKQKKEDTEWQVSRDGSDIRLPATVPGTVLTSYIKAGAVPDPDFGDNWEQISESFFNSDFIYRKEFESAGTEEGKRSILQLDGINWKADVSLNGKGLGRVEGAFQRGNFDVTDVLVNGRNILEIKIIHNAHPGAVKEKTARWTGYNGGILGADNPTFHASIGWDWMTTVRGRNTGIWGDVRIVQKGPVEVADPLVESRIGPDGLASISARVSVSGKLEAAEVEGWIGDIRFCKTVDSEGEVIFSPEEFQQLKDRRMKLWWPNGYGESFLYDSGFIVRVDGAVSDSLHFKAGIREVRRIDRDGALTLYVNGVRVNPMGGNWGFPQQTLEYSPEQYDIAVGYHRLENFNMIRNWVGQTPHQAFYDACDRHGIMVWQDFWLANPSDGPDPDDETMFLANARDWVSRIRRHPSIVLYCGRNEGYPPESLDTPLRDEVVAGLHPDIPYISSSADGPVSGRGPYRAESPEFYFSNQSRKFHSERGMPNVPVVESLRKMMPEDSIWPQGEMWGKHDFTADGAQKAVTYNSIMQEAFGPCNSAEEFCALAQWLNYEGYRAMFESANSAGRMGLLLWMSHSCWPSMVWCTYDYYFQPSGAFFGCKKACEPLHIQYNAATKMIEAVAHGRGADELKAVIKVYGYRGGLLSEKSEAIDLPADSTVRCFAAEPPEGEPVYYLVLTLLDTEERLVSENFYILGAEPGNIRAIRDLPKAKLSRNIKWIGTNSAVVIVRNDSETPALLLRMIIKDRKGDEILPVDYSDNYFSLMPGESKTVAIKWKQGRARNLDITQLYEQ